MKERSFNYELFGGEIEVIVYDSDSFALDDIMKDFYKEALRLQKIFNFFDEKSELSELNRKRRMRVSDDLLKVIERGINFSKMTNGKYDISLGKMILARKRGENTEVNCSYHDIILHDDQVEINGRDALIDLGSIAKGYITDRLADFLKNKGVSEFLIDSRGDIVFSGAYEHIIGIQHPRDEGIICKVKIKGKGIATSGDYNQFYGGYNRSHIVNSRDIVSVSVIAECLEDADVYATALFVSDDDERKIIMATDRSVKSLLIRRDLKTEEYNNFSGAIVK